MIKVISESNNLMPKDNLLFVSNYLDYAMICLSCSYKWKRKKIYEYFSFLSTCPNCGSRFVSRNDFILLIHGFFKKIIQGG